MSFLILNNVTVYLFVYLYVFRCCGGTGTIVSIHNALYAGIITKNGSPEQKKKFLPDFMNGLVGCFALSEPGIKFMMVKILNYNCT